MNLIGKYKGLFLVLFLLIGNGTLMAQTGGLTGKVYDKETNEPLPYAKVIIEGTNKGANTGDDGTFTITGIKPNDYSISIIYSGYPRVQYTGITIKKGETLTLNVSMKPKSVKTVEIIGKAEIIDLTGGRSGNTLGEEDIAESTGRDVSRISGNARWREQRTRWNPDSWRPSV